MPDQLDLGAIKERCEKATPGQWRIEVLPTGVSALPPPIRVHSAGWTVAVCEPRGNYAHQYNADFIAHARTDLPACVAEIEGLREELRIQALELGETKRWYCVAVTERDKVRARVKELEEREDVDVICGACKARLDAGDIKTLRQSTQDMRDETEASRG